MLSRAKEFQRLFKKIGEISDGQACIENVNWDDGSVNTFKIVVRPKTGLYKGGAFVFEIHQAESADEFPEVHCLTPIYHPNIDWESSGTNVCLNIFSYMGSKLPMEILVHGLIFILNHPNLDSQLVSIENEDGDALDEEDFKNCVVDYMAGREVMGYKFESGFVVIDGVTISEDISRFLNVKQAEDSNNDNKSGAEVNVMNKQDNETQSAETDMIKEGDDMEICSTNNADAAMNKTDDDTDDSYEMLGLTGDGDEVVLAIKEVIPTIGNQACECPKDYNCNVDTEGAVGKECEEEPPRKRVRLDKFFSTGQRVLTEQTPAQLLCRDHSFVKTASESFQNMLLTVFKVKS